MKGIISIVIVALLLSFSPVLAQKQYSERHRRRLASHIRPYYRSRYHGYSLREHENYYGKHADILEKTLAMAIVKFSYYHKQH